MRLTATFYAGTVIIIPLLVLGIGFLIYQWSAHGQITLKYLKMLFGFVLMFLSAGIVGLIVREGSNLSPDAGKALFLVLGIFTGLAAVFGQWAFGTNQNPDKGGKDKDNNSDDEK